MCFTGVTARAVPIVPHSSGAVCRWAVGLRTSSPQYFPVNLHLLKHWGLPSEAITTRPPSSGSRKVEGSSVMPSEASANPFSSIVSAAATFMPCATSQKSFSYIVTGSVCLVIC